MANVLNLHVRVHINRKRKIVYKMSLHVLINVSPKNVNRDDVKIVVQVNLFVFIFDSGARSDLTQTQTAQQSTENGCVLESSSSSHSTSHVCVQLLCINLETA